MILSAGLRDLLMRLLSRRGIRELVVIGFVMISALPQLVFTMLPKEKLQALERSVSGLPALALPMPWNVTGRLATGFGQWTDALAMLAWLGLAAWFGYGQFLRNLRWDAGQARSDERAAQKLVRTGLWDRLLSLPSRILPDPWGVLVEKEIRFLSRAPRFRLVFFMGFTFGLAIWLPLMMGGRKSGGFFTENFLVVLSLYAALLMGEVLFWNLFGFDRQAAQAYFAMPVPLRRVVLAKNLTALIMLLLEIAMVGLVVFALRLPITLEKVAESAAITLLFSLFLFSAGNLASMKYPRAVDPAQTWRNNSSAKVQGLLMLVYPALLAPIGLSYLARFAFDSQLAFYLVWAANLLVAAMAYGVSLDSAMEVAEREKERIVQTLSSGESLVA
jgi:ABC-2 type transport system permease protein